MYMKPNFGLPEKVIFCKKCVISNQRPNSVVEFKHREIDKKPTTFIGEDGICHACKWNEMKRKIDWNLREKQLQELLNKYRKNDGSYDMIIPGSGGKDSTFVAHIFKYKYKMNPLTVTWAPHLYTDIGFRNLQNWIHAGFDNILITPNGKVHNLLTRLSFLNLLHPFQPFIIGQKSIAPRMSVLYNIPLVMYGESPVEYGNNLEEANFPIMSRKYYSGGADLSKLILGGVPAIDLINDKLISEKDLHFYIPLSEEYFEKTGTEVHHFSFYHKWDPQENYYYAIENCHFEPNTERTQGSYSKYSSIDDKIDPFHYYTTLIKFGLGRASYDAAQEIRNEKITREEGVSLVKKYDMEFPTKFYKDFLNYTGLTDEQFHSTVDKFRSPHLWEKQNGEWKLKYQVFNDGGNNAR